MTPMRTRPDAQAAGQHLHLVPENKHIALLLRHAHRDPINNGTYGDEVGLTGGGCHDARELGRTLGRRQVGRIVTSPIIRCQQTAKELAAGAGWDGAIALDWRLGQPGPFVVEPELAGPLFLNLGIPRVVRMQLDRNDPLPGMRPTHDGVSLLLDFLIEGADLGHTLSVFVTHDAILAVVVGYLLGVHTDAASWPGFLEGVYLWRSPEGLAVVWRGAIREIDWSSL